MYTLKTTPFSQGFSFSFADIPVSVSTPTPIILPSNSFVVEIIIKSNVLFVGAGAAIRIVDSNNNLLAGSPAIQLQAIPAGSCATYTVNAAILPMNPGLVSILMNANAYTAGQGDVCINYYLLD
jgi:hypothetical protein